jgi:hypothetical protein
LLASRRLTLGNNTVKPLNPTVTASAENPHFSEESALSHKTPVFDCQKAVLTVFAVASLPIALFSE